MKRRILNIASYQRPDRIRRLKSTLVFILTSVLLIGFVPFIFTTAADDDRYQWNPDTENLIYSDHSEIFGDYNGSFVLYNSKENSWNIYNKEQALQRLAPDSTYKIYCALFGLEEGTISPENTSIKWNG